MQHYLGLWVDLILANVTRDALVQGRQVADAVVRLNQDQVLRVDGSTTGTEVVAVKLGAEKFQSLTVASDAQLLVASLVAADHHHSQNQSYFSPLIRRHFQILANDNSTDQFAKTLTKTLSRLTAKLFFDSFFCLAV